MTWSIVAHDPATGAFAVAVTTCAFAVGASCPFVRPGVGAVSTQSMTNRYLGPAVLDGMARGLSPTAAIESALAGDEGRGIRQVHAVDRHGRSAAWTGQNCVEWCGDRPAQGFSVAGNMLASEAVLADTVAAFVTRDDLPLAERLVAALEAGDAAGGDRRGRQSAALLLTTVEDFPDINLRVDDHPEPVGELGRLLGIWRRDREPGLRDQPRKANPSGWIDLDAIEASWRRKGSTLRFRR
ncbi:MAG: major pilin protein fimA [uncultured Craurococcus sp.]|uniref:Major pilin protein fimA n=1 Tax=uncultured Craurococcus sp. TaxID=1135998 RepID=A0A6J4IEJ6_9PROT|nr:MAG: major pilin protein fimA [uncultured Craurococcus sp.]